MIGRVTMIAALALALPAAAQLPERITLFCGGGATGGGGGVTAQGDGTLLRIRQAQAATPQEQEALPGRLAPVAHWHALLDAARFEALPRGTPGNITCSLTRERGGQGHVVLWRGPGLPDSLPAPLREVVTQMRLAMRD